MTYQIRFSRIKNRSARRVALALAFPFMFVLNLALQVLFTAMYFFFAVHRNQRRLFKSVAHCWSNDTPYVISVEEKSNEEKSVAYVVQVELESGINPDSPPAT